MLRTSTLDNLHPRPQQAAVESGGVRSAGKVPLSMEILSFEAKTKALEMVGQDPTGKQSAESPSTMKVTKRVSFASMASQVPVQSKNDMNVEEKGRIWWQPADYEMFVQTAKLLAKEMLEGETDKLLLDSERTCKRKRPQQNETEGMAEDRGCDENDQDHSHKWWCRFGHSRRGLEHIACKEEGRHRHLAVRSSIRFVIAEQNRVGKGCRDHAEKLRQVSLRYTTWASHLAMATASSDAHAVQSSFSREQRTRESYLLDITGSSDGQPQTTEGVVRSTPQVPETTGKVRAIPDFIRVSLYPEALRAAKAKAVLDRLDYTSSSQLSPHGGKRLKPSIEEKSEGPEASQE